MKLNWKVIALGAIVAEYITLGCAMVIRGRANSKIKEALAAIDVMGNCTEGCLKILGNEDFGLEQKLDRMIEEFQFVQVAIEEAPTKGKKNE